MGAPAPLSMPPYEPRKDEGGSRICEHCNAATPRAQERCINCGAPAGRWWKDMRR